MFSANGSQPPPSIPRQPGVLKSSTMTNPPFSPVEEAIEGLRFNVAVAQVRTLTNAIEEFEPESGFDTLVLRESLETAAKLIGRSILIAINAFTDADTDAPSGRRL